MIQDVESYRRWFENGIELHRTEQWIKLKREMEECTQAILTDEGKGLKKECDNNQYFIGKVSAFLYWIETVLNTTKKDKTNLSIEMFKKKITSHGMFSKDECIEITKLTRSYLESLTSPSKNEQEHPNPLLFLQVKEYNRREENQKINYIMNLVHRKKYQKALDTLDAYTYDYENLYTKLLIIPLRSCIKGLLGDYIGEENDINEAINHGSILPVLYLRKAKLRFMYEDIESVEINIQIAWKLITREGIDKELKKTGLKIINKEFFKEEILKFSRIVKYWKIYKQANHYLKNRKF